MLSSKELIELSKKYQEDDALASVIVALASARLLLETFDIPDAEYSLLEACLDNFKKINDFMDKVDSEVDKFNKYESN